MSITVVLADDSEAMRTAILHLLQLAPDVQVLAQGSDFTQTIELASKLHPQVILLDVHMNDERSMTPAQLKAGLTGSRLLAMSIWTDEETNSFAKAIGADTLLDKSKLGIELIPAIRFYGTEQNREQSLDGQATAAPD